jgi:hypothetical protein
MISLHLLAWLAPSLSKMLLLLLLLTFDVHPCLLQQLLSTVQEGCWSVKTAVCPKQPAVGFLWHFVETAELIQTTDFNYQTTLQGSTAVAAARDRCGTSALLLLQLSGCQLQLCTWLFQNPRRRLTHTTSMHFF